MKSRATLLGHSIHPMLVVFPLGLLSTAVLFDFIHLFSRNALWAQISFWMIAVGVLGGLAAAVFGAIDWLALPRGTRAHRIGLLHGLVNLVVVGAFAVSWLLRLGAPATPSSLAVILGFLGVSLACVSGWLGGELVERLGVGVHPNAHLDAPSSLASASTPTPNPARPMR